MAVYDVPYTIYQLPATAAFPNGRQAKRPVLRVKLINGVNELSCFALVDSGADNCAFPRSFMQPLNLDPLTAPGESTVGVSTSQVSTHFCNIEIDLGPVRLPVYAGFTVGLDQMGIGLLGQDGFFDRFCVAFRHAEGIFQIETIQSPYSTAAR